MGRYLAILSCVVAACVSEPMGTVLSSGPAFDIRDAAHGAGADGFYFLPPLVPDPPYSGTFDGALNPTVSICALLDSGCSTIAEFTSSSANPVKLDLENEHYSAIWHTADYSLDAETTYRIVVSVAATELGHADVDVVSSGRELKDVNTGDYVPLKDGRTLPIKFRVEHGSVSLIGPDGGTGTTADGRVVLTVPAGALDEPTGITIRPVIDEIPTAEGIMNGSVWEFGPSGTNFDPFAELRVDIPTNTNAADLTLLHVVDGLWEESDADRKDGRVTGPIDSFSWWALGKRAASVEVVPSSATLEAGENLDLSAMVLGGSGRVLESRRVFWSSTDGNVAAVDDNGTVSALSDGVVTIVARVVRPSFCPPFAVCAWFISGAAEITVGNPTVPAAAVSVTPTSATLGLRETVSLNAAVFDASGNELTDREIIWTSQAPAVATVDPQGTVTAVGLGSTTITATVESVAGQSGVEVVDGDRDGDGILDSADACPDGAGPPNNDGCPVESADLEGTWVGWVRSENTAGDVFLTCGGYKWELLTFVENGLVRTFGGSLASLPSTPNCTFEDGTPGSPPSIWANGSIQLTQRAVGSHEFDMFMGDNSSGSFTCTSAVTVNREIKYRGITPVKLFGTCLTNFQGVFRIELIRL